MNVPRETQFNRDPSKRRVYPLRLPAAMFAAVEAGKKTEHRVLLCHRNAGVRPGGFAGLDLESGRVRELPGYNAGSELRARCRFTSGDVRAVSVFSKVRPGELFWIAPGAGALTRSKFTAEVQVVNVCRLQDMSDADANAEGIHHDIDDHPETGARSAFQVHWDRRRQGTGYWRLNPWVWVYRWKIHAGNVCDVFAGEV